MESIQTQYSLGELNKRYKNLSPKDRIVQLYEDFDAKEIMLTSSFAATSAMLLKLFAEVNRKQEVFFIDTGYHFGETIVYKDFLTALYGLNVKNLRASKEDHQYSSKNELWKSDPDACCGINKVKPIDFIKQNYQVWVSGLMHWQSDHRATLDIFEQRQGIIKFYPLLDVNKEDRDTFITDQNLPPHPLLSQGYSSIGCKHCTQPGSDRNGRWNNSPKTECGLHL